MDLSGNSFSGAIPWHLPNLTIMTELQNEYMDEGDLQIGGTIWNGPNYLGQILSVVTKGQQLQYGRTLIYFRALIYQATP